MVHQYGAIRSVYVIVFSSVASGPPTLYNIRGYNMHYISLVISGLLANIFFVPRVVKVHTVEEVRDPTGLVRNDIDFIKKHIVKEVYWRQGDTLEAVAYRQGQMDTLRIIEDKVVGRRVSRPA